MPEPSFGSPGISGYHRLLLALSMALVTHILLFAGLPAPITEPRDTSHRLVFKLSSSAAMPTTNSDAAGPAAATRHQEFRIPPQAPRVITARNPEVSTASKPEEQPESSPSKRAPKKPDQTRPMQSASQTAQSAPVSSPRDKPQNTIQQVSRSPSESDPYLIKLAAHLAAKLEQQRIPAMAQLTSPVTVQLELKLLANGALTRARVVEPTGKKGIDEAAYRAALAASPYPEPKGETTDRFEVTLVFTPKR